MTGRAPVLAEADRARLAAYTARFNARDFDALRDLLADEVRVEVVNRTRLNGRGEAGRYFTNYGQSRDWQLVPGLVEGRPAVLVHDPDDPQGVPLYFILLDWTGERLLKVRDFRYARYVTDGAELIDFR